MAANSFYSEKEIQQENARLNAIYAADRIYVKKISIYVLHFALVVVMSFLINYSAMLFAYATLIALVAIYAYSLYDDIRVRHKMTPEQRREDDEEVRRGSDW